MRTSSRLLKRLLVLSVMLFCLGWLSFADAGNDALARPCCQSCPGFTNPGEEVVYCSDQCGGQTSGSCYDQCMNTVYNCYRNCYYCSGGGGGGGEACPGGCPIGYYCAASNMCEPLY